MKHASVVPAARILVIEDNGSDVFLLDRALKKQEFRFELVHLLNGRRSPRLHPAAGRLCGGGDSRPDPDGFEPLQVHRRRHLARDPKRQTPRPRSGVRVEFFPVPARRGSAQETSEFPSSSPSLPVWINSWRSVRSSTDLLAGHRTALTAVAFAAALQSSHGWPAVAQTTARRKYLREWHWRATWRVPVKPCVVAARKVMVARGQRPQAPAGRLGSTQSDERPGSGRPPCTLQLTVRLASR